MRPPVPAPASLRPFLHFHKLPPNALVPVRRAVEGDEAFRRRAAEIATEDNVGRPGWLWLVRPAGWEAELEQLAIDAAAAHESGEAARAERDARKRVDAAEQAARTALAEAAAAVAALGGERARREALEQALAKAERRAGQLEIELGGARRRAEQGNALVVAAESARAQAEADADAVRAELERTRRQLVAAREAGEEALTELALLRGPVGLGRVDAPLVAAPAPSPLPAGVAAAAAALRDAAEATTRAGGALAEAAASLGAAASAGAGGGTGDTPPASPVRPSRRARPQPRRRRAPLSLPGGLFDDTVEAAAHLVRTPGVLLVVDGYNVAKLGWPQLPLADQRIRLLDALEEVVARFGTDVHVVFDGADVGTVPVGRRSLRVDFSPAGVAADEVIVGLVEALPPERPVVVATNDGDVRRRSRAGGANVVSSDQLLAVARRA